MICAPFRPAGRLRAGLQGGLADAAVGGGGDGRLAGRGPGGFGAARPPDLAKAFLPLAVRALGVFCGLELETMACLSSCPAVRRAVEAVDGVHFGIADDAHAPEQEQGAASAFARSPSPPQGISVNNIL